MIFAIDIETIGNADIVDMLPPPEVKTGNIKDPAKIAAKEAEAKEKQIEKMALDALTARIICFAAVSMDEDNHVEIIPEATDAAETTLVQSIMRFLGSEDARIVTWNGMGFDLPMIYKRAMILGIDPADFGAPPLPAWMKRYSTDRHYDLMKIWSGWASGADGYVKLDTVANMVLNENKTEGIDVKTFPTLMKTEKGRAAIAEYCLQDTALTWRLWEKMNGFMFV